MFAQNAKRAVPKTRNRLLFIPAIQKSFQTERLFHFFSPASEEFSFFLKTFKIPETNFGAFMQQIVIPTLPQNFYV